MHSPKYRRMDQHGSLALKLDMSKAYDRVEWSFLEQVIHRMGFVKPFVSLIIRCVTLMNYLVCMNGEMGKRFKPIRGLRQGDPLSPYLFLICSEGFSSLRRGKGSNYYAPTFCGRLHFFGDATEMGACDLKNILQEYEICSGQCINFDKSVRKCFGVEEGAISEHMEVKTSRNPEKYLGLSNMDKMINQVKEWSTRFLSIGGKEVFIKVVLQAIPTYYMACFFVTKIILCKIGKHYGPILVTKRNGKHGIYWCEWRKLGELK
ncbi:reverse transcriptase [Gossypium australe]|uniref:Reverse transcriptase n=1 Tax=Gossypium australe TaxID=47621 RepID=A0A5B6VVW6_9ROSI|nr:reverse transcriptase [Gossypium australe]